LRVVLEEVVKSMMSLSLKAEAPVTPWPVVFTESLIVVLLPLPLFEKRLAIPLLIFSKYGLILVLSKIEVYL
jgi:hypothetical protein